MFVGRDELSTQFQGLGLHDARIREFRLLRASGVECIVVKVEKQSPSSSGSPNRGAELWFFDCAYVDLAIDCHAKAACDDAIFSTLIEDDTELKDKIQQDDNIGLDRSLEECVLFCIYLCPPGGRFRVLAKSFSLIDDEKD